jgi:RluA family pseudouridine synthase
VLSRRWRHLFRGRVKRSIETRELSIETRELSIGLRELFFDPLKRSRIPKESSRVAIEGPRGSRALSRRSIRTPRASIMSSRPSVVTFRASNTSPQRLLVGDVVGKRIMRWIVGPEDGSTVREVLARAAADVDAVRDGRVFVGPRRVKRQDEPVRDGDVVEVAPPRPPKTESVTILARTRDLVAVDKPAGMPTIADHAGAAHALLAVVARALGLPERALHPTSRLDRDVSGVVVLAQTKAAAGRLAQARTERRYDRRYVAIAAKTPAANRGTWDAPIGRAQDPRLRAVAGREAVDAATRYSVCAQAAGGEALLAVAPVTGRTHQIRVHAAHAGAPLLGDRAYDGPTRLTMAGGRVLELRRVALHAARVVVPDEHGAPLVVTAPTPPDLVDLWSALGGDAHAWDVSTSCALG